MVRRVAEAEAVVEEAAALGVEAVVKKLLLRYLLLKPPLLMRKLLWLNWPNLVKKRAVLLRKAKKRARSRAKSSRKSSNSRRKL
jgi:hypothetical protein